MTFRVWRKSNYYECDMGRQQMSWSTTVELLTRKYNLNMKFRAGNLKDNMKT